jgi:hypothetical protein
MALTKMEIEDFQSRLTALEHGLVFNQALLEDVRQHMRDFVIDMQKKLGTNRRLKYDEDFISFFSQKLPKLIKSDPNLKELANRAKSLWNATGVSNIQNKSFMDVKAFVMKQPEDQQASSSRTAQERERSSSENQHSGEMRTYSSAYQRSGEADQQSQPVIGASRREMQADAALRMHHAGASFFDSRPGRQSQTHFQVTSSSSQTHQPQHQRSQEPYNQSHSYSRSAQVLEEELNDNLSPETLQQRVALLNRHYGSSQSNHQISFVLPGGAVISSSRASQGNTETRVGQHLQSLRDGSPSPEQYSIGRKH